MVEPHPLPLPDDEPAGPSLAGRALGWRPGLPRLDRRSIATALLAVVPLLAAVGMSFAAERMDANAAHIPAAAVARSTSRTEPLSITLATISRALPPGAKLAEIARDGRLVVIVETTDPERLRDALAADPALVRLRSTGEAALADGGYRVTLEEAR